MRFFFFVFALLSLTYQATAQHTFSYNVELKPVNVSQFPGLHSYAFGQTDGKWVFIGGRLDGIHARQPFASFPESQNNTNIYVVDVKANKVWTASVTGLATNLKEQMQSTNMNFCQVEDTLYIIGGYAFSQSKNDHVTLPFLTTINLSDLVDDVVKGTSISANFKQITDTAFEVTGGHLEYLDGRFYLVGGHSFMGRYNPMGHNTYTQKYTDQIRSFAINNSGSKLAMSDYKIITDPVHLHRRDYNLVPQIFPDKSEGFMISSGVFQQTVDLPFLYPVEITKTGYKPQTGFNQYLSHYHSAHANFYSESDNLMHSIFFGGLSQYYYKDSATLVKDDNVPFVKTISRVSRDKNGVLKEFLMHTEMPNLQGASAEFFINPDLDQYDSRIFKLDEFKGDTIQIGHIVGGIYSSSSNPFTGNNTSSTSSDKTIYAVNLVKSTTASSIEVNGITPYDVSVFPNPIVDDLHVSFDIQQPVRVEYFVTNVAGQVIAFDQFKNVEVGTNNKTIALPKNLQAQPLFLTVIFDEGRYYVYKKLVKR